jgi:transposase
MDNSTVFLGIDDSKKTLVYALLLEGQDIPLERATIPNRTEAIRKLANHLTAKYSHVKACYEAGFNGYHLQRQFKHWGIDCQVVAPSLTPKRAGERVKTDRRDALQLAELFRSGQLHPIRIPTVEEEGVRDLTRLREDQIQIRTSIRHRILKLTGKYGFFHEGCHWTKTHMTWLKALKMPSSFAQSALELLLVQLDQQEFYLSDIEKQIFEISRTPFYASMVDRLRCFKGVDTIAAMILLSEIHDFSRFRHPRELMGFLGFAVTEYSSGPRRRLTHLTKTGNNHLRRLLVEIAHCYTRRATAGPALQQRRRDADPRWVQIAIKAQVRLHKRYLHLIFKGKARNEAIAAMAREFCAFLWEMCVLPEPQMEVAAA